MKDEKNKIFIYGGGGHAKVVIDIVEREGIAEIAFLLSDDTSQWNSAIYGYRVVGGRDALLSRQGEVSGGIVCIGGNVARIRVADWLEARRMVPVKAVHPSARIGRGARIDEGTVVMAGAVVNSDAEIGRHVIINTRAGVDHDCVISDGVHIAPGATLCGAVRVGRGAFVCAGATVLPNITIGAGAVVGAGATVVRDVPEGVTVVGTPARIVSG